MQSLTVVCVLAFACLAAAGPASKYNKILNPAEYYNVKYPGLPAPPMKEGDMTKIVNGEDANVGEFPFQVSLRFAGGNFHTCGGTIITDRHVVTAAHCVQNGALDIIVDTIYLSSGGTRYKVSQVIEHEEYDPDNYWKNDIALLVTATVIQFNNNVKQISLPSQPLNGGEQVTVSGWGRLSSNDDVSERLQKINLDALGLQECRNLIGVNIADGQVCAGAVNGVGVCNGDSGGPLARNGALHGIVSWGYVPCGGRNPDVYTRVSSYVSWIEGKLGTYASRLTYA